MGIRPQASEDRRPPKAASTMTARSPARRVRRLRRTWSILGVNGRLRSVAAQSIGSEGVDHIDHDVRAAAGAFCVCEPLRHLRKFDSWQLEAQGARACPGSARRPRDRGEGETHHPACRLARAADLHRRSPSSARSAAADPERHRSRGLLCRLHSNRQSPAPRRRAAGGSNRPVFRTEGSARWSALAPALLTRRRALKRDRVPGGCELSLVFCPKHLAGRHRKGAAQKQLVGALRKARAGRWKRSVPPPSASGASSSTTPLTSTPIVWPPNWDRPKTSRAAPSGDRGNRGRKRRGSTRGRQPRRRSSRLGSPRPWTNPHEAQNAQPRCRDQKPPSLAVPEHQGRPRVGPSRRRAEALPLRARRSHWP